MAIRTVITRGFGNGTFNGSIGDVVLRGYLSVMAGIEASGGLTGSGDLTGQADRLLEMSGELTGIGTLTASMFEGPQINLIGQHQPEIHLSGSV